jgi:hypothetical protein
MDRKTGGTEMKNPGNYLWLCVPALLLATGTALAGSRYVTECGTVITKPGNYKVQNDLSCLPDVSAIEINASNVKLDLKGHTLSCDASGAEKVGAVLVGWTASEPIEKVRISNGTVTGCDDGILLWGTRDVSVTDMAFSGNLEGAITLVVAEKTVIMHNRFEGDYISIRSFGGLDNHISYNSITYSFTGIDLYSETGSLISCNVLDQNYYGVGLGPLFDSPDDLPGSGNIVLGNQVNNGLMGILVYGIGTPAGVTDPQSVDNLLQNNSATGNWFVDLAEVIYDPYADEVFVEDGAACQNKWKRNLFDTQMGPYDCIGDSARHHHLNMCATH